MVDDPHQYSTDELKEHADLLASIQKAENEVESTDIDELRERNDLLASIARHEAR
jgi:hypothetical protein